MKQQYKYFILLVLVFLGILTQAQLTTFYYYQGEKFYLEIDYSRISVVSEGEIFFDKIKDKVGVSELKISNQTKNFTGQNAISFDTLNNRKLHTAIYATEIELPNKIDDEQYSAVIDNLESLENILKVSPTYTIRDKKLGVSNNFYVKLLRGDDTTSLRNMAKNYSMKILGYNEFMPLWFTLSCTKETPYNAIEAANIFHESKLFESSEPEFLYHDITASNDPYFTNQWGLKNTGQHSGTSGIDINAEQAWAVTTGSSNIRVAVFDHGFEMNHPDLQNNVIGTGYDAKTNTSPAWVRGSHGTACAGIVGAQQNNSIGISGAAPSVGLMSISISLLFSDTPQQLANGFNWAWQNGADVISNSWGGYTPSTIIDDAITNTLANGRDSKGTVVVFAAGNENNTNIRYPGNSNPDILVVGAISPCGERKSPASCDGENWGSCYGTQLDIVAPGVLIPTTDRQGTNGYNTASGSAGDYIQNFNGTSSACPHVAAVAALILSKNPNLTRLQVANIIESTAQKVGGYNYQTTSGRPNGTWHEQMGYGLVDAYAAIQAADCPTTFIAGTISTDVSYFDCKIEVVNATIQNNADVVFDAEEYTIIDGTFEVQTGSTLEVK